MHTYTIVDDVVVEHVRTEPDLKMLAIEAFKVAAFKWWNAQ